MEYSEAEKNALLPDFVRFLCDLVIRQTSEKVYMNIHPKDRAIIETMAAEFERRGD